MKMSVRFEGGKELAATLREMPRTQSRQAQEDALLYAAEPILVEARRHAPQDRGLLADRIDAMPSRRRLDVASDTQTAVIIGPWKQKAFWGFFQEWGTADHPAQPFMRPAFDGQHLRSLELLRKRLWENIQSWLHLRDVS